MPLAPSYSGPAANPVNLVDGNGRSFLPGGGQTTVINVSASGATVLIAAVPGRRIYCYAYLIVADSSNQVSFLDGVTPVEGPIACGATNIPGGAAPAVTPPGFLFRTSVGSALSINLGSAVHVGGRLSYWLDND